MAQILLDKKTAESMHQLQRIMTWCWKTKMFWRRHKSLHLAQFPSLYWNSKSYRVRVTLIMPPKTPLVWIVTKSNRNIIIIQRRSRKRTATSSKAKRVQIVLSPLTKIRNSCQPWLSKRGLIWLEMDRNKHQLIQLCFHQSKPLSLVSRITTATLLQSNKRYSQRMWAWREEVRVRKTTEFSLPCQRHPFPSQVSTKSSPWETCQLLSIIVNSQHVASETCRTNSSRDRASAHQEHLYNTL